MALVMLATLFLVKQKMQGPQPMANVIRQ